MLLWRDSLPEFFDQFESDHKEEVPKEPRALVIGNATRAHLESAGQFGAKWFYWIAGVTLVNTAIIHCNGGFRFAFGLYVTAIVDVVAKEVGKKDPRNATLAMVIAIAFSLITVLVVFGFGWFSQKRILWVFAIGIGLYLIDVLLLLMTGDLRSAACHGFAIAFMVRGFNAFRRLASADKKQFDDDVSTTLEGG